MLLLGICVGWSGGGLTRNLCTWKYAVYLPLLCGVDRDSVLHLMSVSSPGYRSSMPAESAGQMLQYTKMEALGEIVRRRINVGKYFLSQELVID